MPKIVIHALYKELFLSFHQLCVADTNIISIYQIKLLRILVALFEFHSTWGLETTLKVHLGDLFLANRDVSKTSRIIIDPYLWSRLQMLWRDAAPHPRNSYVEALICGGDGVWRWLGLGEMWGPMGRDQRTRLVLPSPREDTARRWSSESQREASREPDWLTPWPCLPSLQDSDRQVQATQSVVLCCKRPELAKVTGICGAQCGLCLQSSLKAGSPPPAVALRPQRFILFLPRAGSLCVWASVNSALSASHSLVDKTVAPKDVHDIIPKACQYVTWGDKGTLLSVTTDAEMGSISGLSRWSNVIPSVFVTGTQGVPSQRERADHRSRAQSNVINATIWRSPGAKACGGG